MKARKASFRRNYLIKSIFFFLFLKCFVICGFGQELSTFSLQFGKELGGFSTRFLRGSMTGSLNPLRSISSYKEEFGLDGFLVGVGGDIKLGESYFLRQDGLNSTFLFLPENDASNSHPLQAAWINPDPGYLSFLCRKELEIEKKSPVAFWFQIGENDPALVRHKRGGAVSSFKLKFRLAN